MQSVHLKDKLKLIHHYVIQYELMVSNFGAQPPIIVNALWYVTNDILHHDLNVSYVRDEIKKLSQKYADRLVEHPNILAIDFMNDAETLGRLKRKLSQDLCI